MGANNKNNFQELGLLAESLGINFKNWQIGSKKKKEPIIPTKMTKNAKVINKSLKKKKIASNDDIKEEKGEAKDNAGGGSKKHKCDTCSRSFDQRNKLVRHQMIHSGIKFPCFGCSSQFSRKDKLNKHVRERHPELQGNLNDVSYEVPETTETKPYEEEDDTESKPEIETNEEHDTFNEDGELNEESFPADVDSFGNTESFDGEDLDLKDKNLENLDDDEDGVELDEDL